MKTYVFKMVLEPDEYGDGSPAWSISCPALADYGAHTFGDTPEAAIAHMEEVIGMILEELHEEGKPIPSDVQVSSDPLVAVTV